MRKIIRKTKKFDCIEMKRNIQDKIYDETKNMSKEEYLAFIRKQVDEGPFGELLKQNNIRRRSLVTQR
jgi:hypothetical protein